MRTRGRSRCCSVTPGPRRSATRSRARRSSAHAWQSSELAHLHGPVIGDATLAGADWLNREAPISQALLAQLYAGFVERYENRIAPQHRAVCDRFVASFDGYLGADEQIDGPQGLVHGDYRLDNMLFGLPGADRPLTVVDWQTVSWGPAMTDLAYFIGCALPVPSRRAHADELMAVLSPGAGPTTTLTFDDVRDGVRRQTFAGVMMTIVSPMLVQRTERGDEMFMTMLERHCEQVLDYDALALLPEPSAPQPLQPDPADEFAHPAGTEPMWNESWYCDFVDQGINASAGTSGSGLPPTRAWHGSRRCCADPIRPPSRCSISKRPRSMIRSRCGQTPWTSLTRSCPSPADIPSARTGRGELHDDPSALLRGEPGRAVDVSMDFEWSTVGTPYQYRLTPRYEIPCSVSGSVSVDGRRMTFDAVPGQRDHSWGVRDWWSMEWVWSALHLTTARTSTRSTSDCPARRRSVSATCRVRRAALPSSTPSMREQSFADNGLPVHDRNHVEPGCGRCGRRHPGSRPLRLTAPDGRVSWFARSWASIRTSDGRDGVGLDRVEPQR